MIIVNQSKFSKILRIQTGLLGFVFLIGMGINFFVDIPQNPDNTFWFSTGGWVVTAHALLGTGALILSVLLFLDSRKLNNKIVERLALVGLIFVALAFVGGAVFVSAGTNDIFSFLMAIGFIVAFGNYNFLMG